MNYIKWIEHIDNIDFRINGPELLVYLLMLDDDLSGFERDNLRNYAYMRCRYDDICRIKNEESIC